MNYTLHQLQIFCAVAANESVTKAAELLHLTQPAVSIQLKNFQDQFEISLTETIGRRIFLTDFGREIATLAEQTLEKAEQITKRRRGRTGDLSGKLRLSIVSTGKYVMPYFLTDFIRAHPGIQLQMDVTNKSGVIKSLEENRVDFALVSILPSGLRINNVELMSNKLYLVGREQLEKKVDDLGFLQTLPMIFREKGSGTRLTMEQFLNNKGIKLHQAMELATNEAIKQAILAGLGYSIMPLIGIRDELQSQRLSIIPVPGLPVESTWNLIWLEQKQFSEVAEQYLEFVRTQKEIIMGHHFDWLRRFE